MRCNTDLKKCFVAQNSNWDHKLLIIKSYIEISSVVLELELWAVRYVT